MSGLLMEIYEESDGIRRAAYWDEISKSKQHDVDKYLNDPDKKIKSELLSRLFNSKVTIGDFYDEVPEKYKAGLKNILIKR